MDSIITISNLNFKYKEKVVFENLSLSIPKGQITTILGPNGCGKSTLAKILLGLLPYNGTVKVATDLLIKDNVKSIRKKIGIVFENPDNQFVSETVMDDIAFTLENMHCEKKEIRKKIEEVSKYLGIYDILEKNPHTLSSSEKQLVALASALVHDPEILILDEAFTMIDSLYKDTICRVLKEQRDKGLTIINITHEMEETLMSDYIIVMKDGKMQLQGTKEGIYKEEKQLRQLGFSLPFMVELSYRLMFYDLIDHVIYDMEEMVDTLWK